MHPCKVCQLLDGDNTPKATAKFCGVCGTYICDDCSPNLLRRSMAMGIIATSKEKRRKMWEEAKARRESNKPQR